MPVIPELWETKVGGQLEVRSLRLAWPTWSLPNPLSTKKYKNRLGVVVGTCNPSYSENPLNQEAEVAMSRDHTTEIQPEQQKKKEKNFTMTSASNTPSH